MILRALGREDRTPVLCEAALIGAVDADRRSGSSKAGAGEELLRAGVAAGLSGAAGCRRRRRAFGLSRRPSAWLALFARRRPAGVCAAEASARLARAARSPSTTGSSRAIDMGRRIFMSGVILPGFDVSGRRGVRLLDRLPGVDQRRLSAARIGPE